MVVFIYVTIWIILSESKKKKDINNKGDPLIMHYGVQHVCEVRFVGVDVAGVKCGAMILRCHVGMRGREMEHYVCLLGWKMHMENHF